MTKLQSEHFINRRWMAGTPAMEKHLLSLTPPMATATNSTQGMLTKFPFKPGIFVTPMSCITPNDILISRHQAGNSSAAEQLIKNQIMMAGGPNKNFTASRLKQALNMEICFRTTFPQLKHFFSGNMTTP